MTWKQFLCSLAAFAGVVCLTPSASAQIGGADLPDLSGLAGAIEKSTQSALPTEAEPPVPGAIYHSGLTVPSVHPGATSMDIVRQMREPIERKTGPNAGLRKLEDGMPALLSQMEAYLDKRGLAKRDLGVAFGVFFVKNWETANDLTLSDPTEIKLVRTVSDNAAIRYKAKYAAMTPASREKVYEQVLMSTILISTLTDAFTKAGKAAETASFRKAAGNMFTTVVGVAPDVIDISPDGKVTGPPPPAVAGTAPPAAPPVNAPATGAPATDAPTPPAAPPPGSGAGKSGAQALPSGHGVKPPQIAGVYAVQAVRVGVGGSLSQPFVPVLALKDGTYTEDFDVPPSELNVADSRRRHASDWGHWRFNAATGGGPWNGSAQHIQTLNGNGVWETSNWIGPLLGGKPGQHLAGLCKASGGGGSAASGFAYGFDQSYTFFPDGRYQFGQDVGFSANSVNGSVAGSSSTGRPKRGTYEIENYGITLRAEDGTVRRLSYARTTDGLVFMGGYAYTLDTVKDANAEW